MGNLRKAIPTVEAAIKRIDPDVIVQRTFYDEVSDRLYVGVVKGLREMEIVLLAHDFKDDLLKRVNQSLEDGLKKLEQAPIS
ncbi:MAG TPA: hypothetical protein VFO63_19420 [Blastocatellia bacterium]|jgi:hypothetical protein|nr:hypothetical protein [Blastocatellia bacterium]